MLLKIPKMDKNEYDDLINKNYVSRIAFRGMDGGHPYIAPFMYVFDGKYIYFLSTKYGKKIELFRSNPNISVEIEEYEKDMSRFRFVTLQGMLKEVDQKGEIEGAKQMFVDMIKNKKLSRNVLAALGNNPEENESSLLKEDNVAVWRLEDVKEIVALKNG